MKAVLRSHSSRSLRHAARGFILAAAVLIGGRLPAADPFAEFVRTTEPRTPEAERQGFHLPPGFEIQLVAAEPQIGKPMNLAFDIQGRLWITQSREYPFPAPTNRPARDAIKILAEIGPDGRAGKITTFAEGLNIPIGLYPYRDGVIAFSIPYIYHFQDTDGDGRADKKELLLGRLGFERDTHGLTSNFRRGFDGWLYADHGYNNNSTLTATDGSTIKMNSGNCYRFKIDGSRVEQHSWGQVNPFGLMFDPLGDLWSADCHSAPVYVLLRGAYYPSFGKPHDGLGFGPAICAHSHGSTAIVGMVYYAAENFPAEYRGHTFIGNVMTCRINRDSYAAHGSTRVAREEPDFLSSDDPWFRPVDLQLGPDGAIYVADFYNRIIGHYEVPLDHPGRDRERGRIWRIVYRGQNEDGAAGPGNNRQKSGLAETLASPRDVNGLVAELGSANLARRMLAMNHLADSVGQPAVAPLKKVLNKSTNWFQKAHALWVLYRLNALDEKALVAAARDPARGVRVHAMRVLGEMENWSATEHALALAGLRDNDAFVQRAAADALGRHPAPEDLRPLLDLRHKVSAEDSHLLYKVRQALRDELRPADVWSRLPLPAWSESDQRAIADVAVAVASPEAGSFLLRHLQKFSEPRDIMTAYLRHAVQFLPEQELDTVANFTRAKFADDLDLQLDLIKSVEEGTAQRGVNLSAGARAWGAELARKLLAPSDGRELEWRNTPVEGMAKTDNPWATQQRDSADGDHGSRFLSSLPPGEQLTGILRSKIFSIPPRLSFFLAGHDGFPDQPARRKNAVRLRAAETQEILAETFAPRNDLAQPVTWDLGARAGRPGYLEITDADNGGAYAWIAIGRFDPPVVTVPQLNPSQIAQRQQSAADLAARLKLGELEPALTTLVADSLAEPDTRAAAARALLALHPNELLAALAPLIREPGAPNYLREEVCQAVAGKTDPAAEAVLTEAMRTSPRRLQVKLAQNLAASPAGAETLLRLAEAGQAPPALLRDRQVKDKILAAKVENAAGRIERLTQGLTAVSEEIQKLIDKRRAGYDAAKASPASGEKIFTQSCRVCHQLDGTGNVVGPQLDGIGNRGLERLCEDVLDPNRSVDPAFRSTLLTLQNGEVTSGLFRREEAEMLVLADSTGKEISIPKKQIVERRESETSLMPDNFGEILSPEDFNQLMAFLLSKGSKLTPLAH